MNSTPEVLPENIAGLHAIIASQQALLAEKQTLLVERDAEIELLRVRLAALLRQRFGKSSEKLDLEIEQLELMLNVLETSGSELNRERKPDTETKFDNVSNKIKPSRKSLPKDLPREEIIHAPEATCPSCGNERYSALGEDVTEVLEFVPAHFKVIAHHRPKWSCRCCETIRQAPVPDYPITRGRAGPGLLSHILVSKFCDHLPFYRQNQIYARQDIDLSRSTMAGWTTQVVTLLRPLLEALRISVMASPRLHTDDTPVPVLKPGNKKTKTGRLWVYVRDNRPYGSADPPAAFYHYSPDRKAIHPKTHLKDFTGILQADGFPGYLDLYKADMNGQYRIAEAACMAHVRRKFHDIFASNASPVAKEAIKRIGALYDIEREIRGQSAEDRQIVREKRSKPLLASFKGWLEEQKAMLPGKSALGVAIRYALTRWAALTLYLTDGTVDIDNNAAERAIRIITLGRKNYLFAGSDTGGESAAAMYSLIQTCKLNGINPEAYLTDILNRMQSYPVNRVQELLPWSWKPL